MEITRIGSVATAFIRPDEGANAGLIHTPEGMILIDTTSSPADARRLFEVMGANLGEVRLVINTHFHSDHTWGNQVFTCPILAHRLCWERMGANLHNEWSQAELDAYVADLERTDSKRAEAIRHMLKEFQVTLPSQVFDERFEGALGGLKYEVIHLGGHTPDLSVVWLPESRVLFASDLIFQGRYPYIFDADILAWINQLNRLLDFNAEVIIPGHGVKCSNADITALRDYLQVTWDRTDEHIRMGHGRKETLADKTYPRFSKKLYKRLHQANIRYMYWKLSKKS